MFSAAPPDMGPGPIPTDPGINPNPQKPINLGNTASATYQAPGANAAKNAKKNQKAKDMTAISNTVNAKALPTPPPPPSGALPKPAQTPQPQPQNSTSDTLPVEKVPQFQQAEFHKPKRGLEYLALGLGLLFPGAPIASIAAGFAGGLNQGAQDRYARDEKQAENQYRVQQAQAKADFDNAKIKYDQDQGLRAQGIDPKTGKPFILPPQLQRILPPGTNRAVTAEDYVNHYSQIAQFYQSVGATGPSQSAQAQAQDYAKQIIEDKKEAAAWQKLLATQRFQNARTEYTVNHADARARESHDTQIAIHNDSEANAWGRLGATEAFQLQRDRDKNNGPESPTKRNEFKTHYATKSAAFYKQWSKDTQPINKPVMEVDPSTGIQTPKKDPTTGQVLMQTPKISRDQQQALTKIFIQLQRTDDPVGAATWYSQHGPDNPIAKDLIMQRGEVEQYKRLGEGGRIGTFIPPKLNTVKPIATEVLTKAAAAIEHLPPDQQEAAIEGASSLSDPEKAQLRKRFNLSGHSATPPQAQATAAPIYARGL